jgi:hypothetical protein
VDGDATPDLDGFDVGLVSHSYGVFIGVPFLAIEPIVSRAYLNAGGALLLRTAEAGSFGELIRALLAGAGILPGSAEFELFMTVGQTVIGAADAASYAAEASMKMPIVHNIVIDDTVVPNQVAGSPMGGNEGLSRLLGLASYSGTQMNPDGLHGVARFLPPAQHGSLFQPELYLPATLEMQGQMASFIASDGTFVLVNNPDLLVPVVEITNELAPQPGLAEAPEGRKRKTEAEASPQPVERTPDRQRLDEQRKRRQ